MKTRLLAFLLLFLIGSFQQVSAAPALQAWRYDGAVDGWQPIKDAVGSFSKGVDGGNYIVSFGDFSAFELVTVSVHDLEHAKISAYKYDSKGENGAKGEPIFSNEAPLPSYSSAAKGQVSVLAVTADKFTNGTFYIETTVGKQNLVIHPLYGLKSQK